MNAGSRSDPPPDRDATAGPASQGQYTDDERAQWMGVYLESNCDLPLFAQRAPSVRGSRTSSEAAESLGPATMNAMQRRLVEFLRTCGAFGATDEEMQLALGMNPSTQRPRRGELADAGLIVRDGTRKTKSRRNADVWRLA
jgi:hypothetical protein